MASFGHEFLEGGVQDTGIVFAVRRSGNFGNPPRSLSTEGSFQYRDFEGLFNVLPMLNLLI